MSEPNPTLETALEALLRRILREELQAINANGQKELLEPEELV